MDGRNAPARADWRALPATALVLLASLTLTKLAAWIHLAANGYGRGFSESSYAAQRVALDGAAAMHAVLLVLAMRDVARRVVGVDARWLALAIGGAVALAIGDAMWLYDGYVDRLAFANEPSGRAWILRFDLVAGLAVAVGLAGPAVRRGSGGPLVAAALIVTTALTFRVLSVGELLHIDGSPAANQLIFLLTRLAYVAALGTAMALVVSGAAAPPPEPERQHYGLAQVGSALVGRLLLAVGAAAFTIMAFSARSPGLLKVTFTVIPAVLALVMIMQIAGTFTTARGQVAEQRLVVAGGLMVWATTVQVGQAILVFRLMRASSGRSMDLYGLDELATALPYLTPAVALLSILVLLSAISAIRRHHQLADDGTVSNATTLFVMATLAALGLQLGLMRKVTTEGELLLMTIVIAGANVAALLAVARCCQKTAWAIKLAPPTTLPAARIAGASPPS